MAAREIDIDMDIYGRQCNMSNAQSSQLSQQQLLNSERRGLIAPSSSNNNNQLQQQQDAASLVVGEKYKMSFIQQSASTSMQGSGGIGSESIQQLSRYHASTITKNPRQYRLTAHNNYSNGVSKYDECIDDDDDDDDNNDGEEGENNVVDSQGIQSNQQQQSQSFGYKQKQSRKIKLSYLSQHQQHGQDLQQQEQLGNEENNTNQYSVNNIGDEFKNLFQRLRLKGWVNRLAASMRSRMFSKITFDQLNMIADKAYNSDSAVNASEFTQKSLRSDARGGQFLLEKKGIFAMTMGRIDARYPVLSPKHRVKSIADFMNNSAILVVFLTLSIALSFQVNVSKIAPVQCVYAGLVVMLMNTLLILNTGFQRLGVVVKSRVAIFMAYSQTQLKSDLLAFVSVTMLILLDQEVITVGGNKASEDLFATIKMLWFLPFLLKLSNIKEYVEQFEDRIIFKQRTKYLIQLVRLFSTIILINHLMACVWIFNSKLNNNAEINWINSMNATNEEWYYQYTLAFYFSTVTMTSVGYGDITARNLSEFILAVCMMLISSGVFGFTLNQIGNIFTEFNSEEKEIKHKLGIINLHMENKNVSHSLRRSIREYLEYIWRENNEKFQRDSQAIVEQLNEDLKRELYLHQNKKIIDYLKNFFTQNLISKAILTIQEQQIKPQQVIQVQGSLDSIGIYLIEKGRVEIYVDCFNPRSHAQTTRQIHVIEEGQIFGMTEFFNGKCCGLNVKALGFVNLLKLGRNEFIEVLRDFRSDSETFNYMKDRQIFCNETKKLGLSCYSCGSVEHAFASCPYLHFVGDKNKIISKLNYGSYLQETQRRKTWIHSLNSQDSEVLPHVVVPQLQSGTASQLLQSNLKSQQIVSRSLEMGQMPLIIAKHQSPQHVQHQRQNRPRSREIVIEIDDPEFEEFMFNYYETLQEYEAKYLSYTFDYNYINDIYPSDEEDEVNNLNPTTGNLLTAYDQYQYTPEIRPDRFNESMSPIILNSGIRPLFMHQQQSQQLPMAMATSITPATPLGGFASSPRNNSNQIGVVGTPTTLVAGNTLAVNLLLSSIPEINNSMQSDMNRSNSIALEAVPSGSAGGEMRSPTLISRSRNLSNHAIGAAAAAAANSSSFNSASGAAVNLGVSQNNSASTITSSFFEISSPTKDRKRSFRMSLAPLNVGSSMSNAMTASTEYRSNLGSIPSNLSAWQAQKFSRRSKKITTNLGMSTSNPNYVAARDHLNQMALQKQHYEDSSPYLGSGGGDHHGMFNNNSNIILSHGLETQQQQHKNSYHYHQHHGGLLSQQQQSNLNNYVSQNSRVRGSNQEALSDVLQVNTNTNAAGEQVSHHNYVSQHSLQHSPSMQFQQMNRFSQQIMQNLQILAQQTNRDAVRAIQRNQSTMLSQKTAAVSGVIGSGNGTGGGIGGGNGGGGGAFGDEFTPMLEVFRNFDKMKHFTIYFPWNNLTFVLFNRASKKVVSQHQYLQFVQMTGKSRNPNAAAAATANAVGASSHNHIFKSKLDLLKNKSSTTNNQLKRPMTLRNIVMNTESSNTLPPLSATTHFNINLPPPPSLQQVFSMQQPLSSSSTSRKINLIGSPPPNPSIVNRESSIISVIDIQNNMRENQQNNNNRIGTIVRSPNNNTISGSVSNFSLLQNAKKSGDDHTESDCDALGSQNTMQNQHDSYYQIKSPNVKDDGEQDFNLATIVRQLEIGRNSEYFLSE